jgi:hypothetical protein
MPDADPELPLNHIPNPAANNTAPTSCQVFQLRRPTILSSPGAGVWSSAVTTAAGSASIASMVGAGAEYPWAGGCGGGGGIPPGGGGAIVGGCAPLV